jgi:hypothetical protein
MGRPTRSLAKRPLPRQEMLSSVMPQYSNAAVPAPGRWLQIDPQWAFNESALNN